MKYVDDLSYLAAPTRKHLSWMTRTMINHNLLSQSETHLDYGCGKGFDVRILKEKGYKSIGYDPYYFPNLVTQLADVVTCGYVLNVLSRRSDRLDVIRKCWELTGSRLIIAAQTGKNINLSLVELRAMIEVITECRAEKLNKGMFVVNKSSPTIEVLTKEKVEAAIALLQNQGWVVPSGAFIKGYCTGFEGTKSRFNSHPSFGLFPGKRYFRLFHRHPVLPGKSGKLVKNVHLGVDKDSDRYRWAEAEILRRNKIMRLKFHCSDFSFLGEFSNCRNWDFLNPDWKPSPDYLGYTDQSKKPVHTRNPNPAIPLM